MKTIEDLTIEEITKILSEAPEGTHRVSLLSTPCKEFGDYFFYRHFFNYVQQWIPSHGWFPVDKEVIVDTLRMDEIHEKAQQYEDDENNLIALCEAHDTSDGDFEVWEDQQFENFLTENDCPIIKDKNGYFSTTLIVYEAWLESPELGLKRLIELKAQQQTEEE